MEANTFQELHSLLDIVQSADIGVVVVNRSSEIEVYNRFMQAHSGRNPEDVVGCLLCDIFPEIEEDWFSRRLQTVFELSIPVYTTWEQRSCLFQFPMDFPLSYGVDFMYQNTTFVPLRSSNDLVEKVAILVYDVTDMAVNKQQLEGAKEELLKLSRTDRLTGLNNRGYWEECLRNEFRRVQRTGEDCTLVIFDIDHFKRINDGFGHLAGDEAIRVVSNILRSRSREVDITGRYGGEEFVAILPHTDIAGAQVFCERLREAVQANSFVHDGNEIRFTISLGVCQYDQTIPSPEVWLANSDHALYYAKEHGRNQVAIYQPE
jgi:diguanylate cyclase (GGDEF)-like protein